MKAKRSVITGEEVDKIDSIAAKHELTEMQARFVRALPAVDFNLTEAARQAGSKAKQLRFAGHEMMRVPKVQSALAEYVKTQVRKSDISVQRVLLEIADRLYLDPAEMFDDRGALRSLKEMPKAVRGCIDSFDVHHEFDADGNLIGTKAKVRMWSKSDAIEKAGKYLSMFNDRVIHAGDDNSPVRYMVVPAKQPAVAEGDGE